MTEAIDSLPRWAALTRDIGILRLLPAVLLFASAGHSQTWMARAQSVQGRAAAEVLRDGQHDFDFNFGVWHTHIRRVLDPFAASSKSVELDGTVTVRKVWQGRAQLEEIEADGPDGHWEGMTLFLYNPKSRQWAQWFANSKTGVMENPLIGSFAEGKGELYAVDTFQGRSILVRGEWSKIAANSHHFEDAYSDDGGRTWHPAFVADLTRETAAVGDEQAAARKPAEKAELAEDRARDFDWDLGTWTMHMSRLRHPLTGSNEWMEMEGTTVNSAVWHGRANLAEVEADGPAGHLELLALRLYQPARKEWAVHFATSGVGVLNTPTGQPMVGRFTQGRGEFYDQEPYTEERAILVRFQIGPKTGETAESEQAFSADGGKTWETNWVNRYTRVKRE